MNGVLTPLIDVTPVGLPSGAHVLAKVEAFNPGLSVKDRPARNMLADIIRSGRASEKTRIIEASSGNMAVSLALAARGLGLDMWLFVPETAGEQRIERMMRLGAEVTVTPGELGTAGAQKDAIRTADGSMDFLYLGQHENQGNPAAHFRGTGPEIWKQSRGAVTGFAAGIGTGGTLLGVSEYLRKMNAGISIAGAVPGDASSIPGLRALNPSQVAHHGKLEFQDLYTIDRDQAEWWQTRISEKTGIPLGPSSGAAMAAAVRLAIDTGGTVATIFPDHGFNYI
jgi:cysteine synthase B